MGNYQELIFYQKARQVVKIVDALIKSWPKTMQAQEISRQLFRSAVSVGANIAEGHGRHQGTDRAKQGTKSAREDKADYIADANSIADD